MNISIGLGARGLKDQDFFTVSDPYVTISRPDAQGGFVKIRTSETKKNTLNPDWNDFLISTKEIGNDKELKLMIQVFDDDGKKGPDSKDKLIGRASYSLKQLEAAVLVGTKLPITDGKRQKPTGQLVVRSFREHAVGGAGPGYPAQPGQAAGYPQPQQGYPGHQSMGYPPQSSFPPQTQPGYPPQTQPGYPPLTHPGYPSQTQPAYPPQTQPAYPPQNQPGNPLQTQPGYPPQNQPGYPPQTQPGFPPQTQPGYPPQTQPAYPPQNQPAYPPQHGQGFPAGPNVGGFVNP